MLFATIIDGQRRPAARPKSADELLIHPIRDNPTVSREVADSDWVKEHGTKPRFYVGGLEWFVDLTAITTETIATYRREAAEEADRLGWKDNLTQSVLVRQQMRGLWGSIARQQYFEVAMGRPVVFSKAALFILSCELALQNMIDRGNLPAGSHSIESGAEVYRRMAIVPACWHVTQFDKDYISSKSASNDSFMSNLLIHTNQSKPEVIEDVSSGLTVTYLTAQLISEFCKMHDLGATPRCSTGRTTLGTKRASPHEIVRL